MKLEYHHLSKSALAGILFLAVFQLASHTFAGVISAGSLFVFSALFSAYLLIDEQRTPNQNHQSHYLVLLIASWLPLFMLIFSRGLASPAFGVWFCVLIFCTFVLLLPSRAVKLNGLALLIFWLFMLMSDKRLQHIETSLALTLIAILMGIINQQVNNLHNKLDIASKSDQLTGCMLPEQFKYELDKAHQLYHRYGTPFSLISIEYRSSFHSEIDLQIWLKEFVQLFQSRLRKTDALCRFNSHKFMLLLPSTNKENASRLSNDLEKCVSAYQFSFLSTPEEYENIPQLQFSILNFTGDETSKRWLRSLQGSHSYPNTK
jgi:GGDEF domain-containing protein